jgi:hypothetical protein
LSEWSRSEVRADWASPPLMVLVMTDDELSEFVVIMKIFTIFSLSHKSRIFWHWIATHNSFIFQGHALDDLWISCIPLKDKVSVQLVRSVVCWIL